MDDEGTRTDYSVPKGDYIRISINIEVEKRKAFFRRINQMLKKVK